MSKKSGSKKGVSEKFNPKVVLINYKNDRIEEAEEVLTSDYFENDDFYLEEKEEYTEQEVRSLLNLVLTKGLCFFMERFGHKHTQKELLDEIKKIVGDDEKFKYYFGDENYISITEASDLFGVKSSVIRSATTFNQIPILERVASVYNYRAKGVRKLKHVRITDVSILLKERSTKK